MSSTISYDNTWGRLDGDATAKAAARQHLTYRPEGYQFTKAYKVKRWDGYKTLYHHGENKFPAGLVLEVAGAIGGHVSIRDLRTPPLPSYLAPPLALELQPHQEEAVTRIIQATRGVIQHPVGAGKSVVIVEATRRIAVPTLVLVGRKELLKQQVDQFKKLVPKCPIGMVGDGVWANNYWVVGMMQTIARRLSNLKTWEETVKWLSGFEAVFIDECQHLPAQSYELILRTMPKAYYRIGLSATPFSSGQKERELQVKGLTGDVISIYDAMDGIEMERLVPADVYLVDPGGYALPKGETDYRSEVRHGIMEHEARNRQVVKLAEAFGPLGPTLVLTERIEHGRKLRAMLLDEGHQEVK